MITRILVAGGGTGGHLFPGIAVVEELRRRLPSLEVLFVGTERGIEARVVPQMGERFHAIEVSPLVGRGTTELARNLATLPRAGIQALSILRSFRPDVVIGLGGYAAGPVLAAAAALRVRSALLEQNLQLGLTNKLLAKSVGRAYLTYEETAVHFGSGRARVFGNPVRRAFIDAARMAGHDPAGAQAHSRSVLVLGGSQGARALNEVLPDALGLVGLSQLGVAVVHQVGASMQEQVERRYRELGVDAVVVPFIDDVARAYLRASLVIARAGASTLAELCAVGRAAILVPYPHAAFDHQTKNALALERAGAAIVLPETTLGTQMLAEQVRALLIDSTRRNAMADAARRQGRPDAAAAVVDDLFAWLGVPTEGNRPLQPDTDEDLAHDGEDGLRVGSPSSPPIRRRPKVKRAELRLREVSMPVDAVR
jgi:UDP-N-acetylglucosamine--N-acetylmuramyl-(pentapeptide) pyrophosphoryl-undecaprenol N-acetylglucosamine transferase